MFNVFKKLATKSDGPGVAAGPSQVPGSVGQQMSDSLKKKFSRGVQYNSKSAAASSRRVAWIEIFSTLQ